MKFEVGDLVEVSDKYPLIYPEKRDPLVITRNNTGSRYFPIEAFSFQLNEACVFQEEELKKI
jgi:hypothetical protein